MLYLTDAQSKALAELLMNMTTLNRLNMLVDDQFSIIRREISANETSDSLARKIVTHCSNNAARIASLIGYLMKLHEDPPALRAELRTALRPERRETMPKKRGAIVLLCSDAFVEEARKLLQRLEERQRDRGLVPHRRIELFHRLDEAPGNLLAALESSPLVIECADSDDHLSADLFAPMLALTAKATPYTMVCLPGYPSLLPDDDAVDFRDAYLVEQGLRRLEADAGLGLDAQGSTKRSNTLQPGPEATDLLDFAKDAAKKGLVVCVGADLVDAEQDLLPRDAAMSTELLAELGLVRHRPTPHRVPLLPMAFAALLNRVVMGGDDPHDWKIEMARRLRQRGGRVATYRALGELLQTLQAGANGSTYVAVVTTNVDLTLECAFIEAGLAFTAVLSRPDDKLPCHVRFPGKRTTADGRIALGDHVEPELQTDSKIYEDVLADYRRDGEVVKLSEQEYVERWRRNELISKQYAELASFQPGKLTTLQAPLLIKILGSCHDNGDFCLSADELPHWRASRLLPLVRGLTGKHAVLLIGYSLADMPFLFLHESLLQADGNQVSQIRPVAAVEYGDRQGKPCDARARIIQMLLVQGLDERAREISTRLEKVGNLSTVLARLGGEIMARVEG